MPTAESRDGTSPKGSARLPTRYLLPRVHTRRAGSPDIRLPAEYLLVLPPGCARLPTLRTASYGHQLACRLQWHMFTLLLAASSYDGTVWLWDIADPSVPFRLGHP